MMRYLRLLLKISKKKVLREDKTKMPKKIICGSWVMDTQIHYTISSILYKLKFYNTSFKIHIPRKYHNLYFPRQKYKNEFSKKTNNNI